GKQELKLAKYFKSDYIKYNVLKTIVSTAICYWLAVALYALINIQKLIDNLTTMDYMAVLYNLLVGFVVVVLGYAIFARIYYDRKYEAARPNIVIYNHFLKKMEDFYKEGVNDAPKNVKVRGTIGENDEFIDY
ncbi:MAG: hypothetical protein K2G89_06885, partial [Lachnospiraceae bacterium]|nr:hypothetical protein [Lachnospiraceae bacterium]